MELVEKTIEEFKKTNIVENNILIKYNDNDEIISLPEQIKILGDYAFRNNQNLKAIFIPSSINRILDGHIEEAITEEEQDDFVGCFSRCMNLKEVRLSKNLKNIPACCFANCISLDNISVPNSVEEISKMAFYGCTNLNSVKLSTKLQSIQMYAFYECCSIKYLFIPKSVKYIGKYAFSGMTENQTIVFECEEKDSSVFHMGWRSGCESNIVWGYKKIKTK